jgi:putative transposase
MDLSVREFDCQHCNQRHDRDINAAINIKNEGLRVLRLALRRFPPHRSETRQTLGTSVIAPEGYDKTKTVWAQVYYCGGCGC